MYGTLTASLDGCIVIDIVEQLALGSICASGTPYTPQVDTYTDPYGRVYTVAADGGLQSVHDMAGVR